MQIMVIMMAYITNKMGMGSLQVCFYLFVQLIVTEHLQKKFE